MSTLRFSVVLLPLLSLACQHQTPRSNAPSNLPMTTAPAGQQLFQNDKFGIALTYPAGWKMASPTDRQYTFTSPQGGNGPIQLTLDIPELPGYAMLAPGMITADRVRGGYIDDAKKKMPDAQVTNLPDTAVPDATEHRVKFTGTMAGKPTVSEAVLIVHAATVYVLSFEVSPAAYNDAQKTLDATVPSIRWTPGK